MPSKSKKEVIRRFAEESDEDSSWFGNFKSPFQEHEFLISLMCFLILIVFILVIFYHPSQKSVLKTCADGSFYDSCSIVKPYYCDTNGILEKKSSICGCGNNGQAAGDSCVTSFQSGAKTVTLNYILDGKTNELNYTVYSGLNIDLASISQGLSYSATEKPIRADFAFQKINQEDQRELLLPLVIAIENLSSDKVMQARIAVSIVQNIPYGQSTRTSSFFGTKINYSRYPYQILYDNQGICGEKSELLAFLLREIGYSTVLFYFPDENHEAVGIKCSVEDSYNRTGYCFVETTGPAIISDSSIQYVGGVKLVSQPDITLISNGDSLPPGLQEYSDARTLGKIRNGRFVLFSGSRFNSLKQKYGLIENYQIA